MGQSSNRQKTRVVLALMLLMGLPLAGWTVWTVMPSASNQGYAPDQPIPFSHKKHAGLYKMECTYCHSSADKSRHASVPSVGTCMNCHSVVKTDSPLIKQIRQAYQDNKPIQWVRIHELPDFVYFPHNRHVAKGVACQTCHGDVASMDKVSQVAPLTMGWCMECHRGETTPNAVLAKVYPDMKHPKGPVAPVSCTTCHY